MLAERSAYLEDTTFSDSRKKLTKAHRRRSYNPGKLRGGASIFSRVEAVAAT